MQKRSMENISSRPGAGRGLFMRSVSNIFLVRSDKNSKYYLFIYLLYAVTFDKNALFG